MSLGVERRGGSRSVDRRQSDATSGVVAQKRGVYTYIYICVSTVECRTTVVSCTSAFTTDCYCCGCRLSLERGAFLCFGAALSVHGVPLLPPPPTVYICVVTRGGLLRGTGRSCFSFPSLFVANLPSYRCPILLYLRPHAAINYELFSLPPSFCCFQLPCAV
ncbi:uncharacterized protein TEOVI_000588900 [Trypanosoma equiperdum]|uniref:T. brucei spp.-specific protein n=2 Tax=Trypanozoon TaxID=39700 RepID=Q4GYI8_TRYB2|nr:hypothetical protein TB927.1.3890 [Trypanosoma brucei brucei TREU927]CAJ16596.1 hypothetical protein TB927.1.3890 [Trypanosoma brucei brucei TREU927]SCU64453.1 hypothetical protein, conserved [Trypanosoma equiperdum]